MNDVENVDTTLLIRLSREGDAAALEALIHTYETRLYRLALSMLDDPVEAEDAVQDAFVRAIRRLNSYRGEASFATWLYAVALNVCRERLRQRRARERLAQVWRALRLAEKSAEPRAEQIAIARAADRAVWRAVQRLNDKQREVIILRYYHDLKIDDIAVAVGVSERTVRTWLQQALDQLREWLKDDV